MGSRVRIRLLHILHFVMDFLFPLLKNSKSGVDDRGHRFGSGSPLRIGVTAYELPTRVVGLFGEKLNFISPPRFDTERNSDHQTPKSSSTQSEL